LSTYHKTSIQTYNSQKANVLLYPTRNGRPVIASPRSAALQATQTEQQLRSPAFNLTL